MTKEYRILTDCDGVLLSWEAAFEEWLNDKGYYKTPDHDVTAYKLHIHYGLPTKVIQNLVAEFNESAAIGYLSPFRDAAEIVPLMRREGTRFAVLTSLSTNKWSERARNHNLNRVFGENVFDFVECLEVGADKDEALEKHKLSYDVWVEDKWENAVVGHKLGYKTFLMSHNHNGHRSEFPEIIRVDNWYEIYQYLENQE